ncbi:hypothetical protein LOD99_12818 [Oopsacas minuta]|uniref:Uncharacterized protein n=1 Tax=Oopsacas minuta TaxID=111878 RepID=A0AAV7JD36_9METZ|nr:hypothetical protein LOD99_12818 [Oopsacas minuta]
MIGAIGYGFGAIITYVLWSVDKNVEYPNTFENSNCTGELSLVSDIEINILTEVPIGRISITIGQIAFLCSLGFGIYLIHYLREKEYDRESNFKYFGVITIVFAFVIFLTGSVLQFKIFEIIFGPFILVIYFCIWVKHIKIFYKILKDRVIKLKVRQSHETKVRRAMESMYQFGIIMSLNGTAFACFLLSEIIEAIFFSISIGIFYGPCIFSYVYRTAAYEPWLRGPEHFQTLILAGTLISIILKLLIVFAQGIILIHYSLGTILFFWEACLIDIKTRFGFGVRTRYTPSLFNPLLFTHQENK